MVEWWRIEFRREQRGPEIYEVPRVGPRGTRFSPKGRAMPFYGQGPRYRNPLDDRFIAWCILIAALLLIIAGVARLIVQLAALAH